MGPRSSSYSSARNFSRPVLMQAGEEGEWRSSLDVIRGLNRAETVRCKPKWNRLAFFHSWRILCTCADEGCVSP